jgi:hypothetical protein
MLDGCACQHVRVPAWIILALPRTPEQDPSLCMLRSSDSAPDRTKPSGDDANTAIASAAPHEKDRRFLMALDRFVQALKSELNMSRHWLPAIQQLEVNFCCAGELFGKNDRTYTT